MLIESGVFTLYPSPRNRAPEKGHLAKQNIETKSLKVGWKKNVLDEGSTTYHISWASDNLEGGL